MSEQNHSTSQHRLAKARLHEGRQPEVDLVKQKLLLRLLRCLLLRRLALLANWRWLTLLLLAPTLQLLLSEPTL